MPSLKGNLEWTLFILFQDSSSETELDHSEPDEPEEPPPKESEQEKQLALLKRENESMRQEIQEFEKHNKVHFCSRYICL